MAQSLLEREVMHAYAAAIHCVMLRYDTLRHSAIQLIFVVGPVRLSVEFVFAKMIHQIQCCRIHIYSFTLSIIWTGLRDYGQIGRILGNGNNSVQFWFVSVPFDIFRTK